MPDSRHQPEDESMARVAAHLIDALRELQRATVEDPSDSARKDLAASRSSIESLVLRFETHLADDMAQRLQLASQLTNLAGSLDRLVDHLQVLSEVMVGLAAPGPTLTTTTPEEEEEPRFMPGGEGVTLSIASVPGFQALMDIQKALSSLEAVDGASVERFQEGDSRLLLHLGQPVSAKRLATALHEATQLNFVIEESRPELMSLRLKVVSGEPPGTPPPYR